jgi:hypothetical protein
MDRSQAYLVCQRRNSEAAYRRFFGPGYPRPSRGAALLRTPRVAAGISAALAALGLAAWLLIS